MIRCPQFLLSLLLAGCWSSVGSGDNSVPVDGGDDTNSGAGSDADSDADGDADTDGDSDTERDSASDTQRDTDTFLTDCPDEGATIFLTDTTTPVGEFVPTHGYFTWSGGGECGVFLDILLAEERKYLVRVDEMWDQGTPSGGVVLLSIPEAELDLSPSSLFAQVSFEGEALLHEGETAEAELWHLDDTPRPPPVGDAPRLEGVFSVVGDGWDLTGELSLPYCYALGFPPCV